MIVDYRDKYNKLLDAIKELQKANPSDEGIQNWINDNVPEIKESEDEKIRKDIISFLRSKNGYMNPDVDWDFHNRWLPWLEKQGQVKKSSILQHEGTHKDMSCKENDNSLTRESKFKVGDWIVQENIGVFKIIEICKSWYEVIDTEGFNYSISFVREYMCHPWTIEDAKDGDVLYSPTHRLIWIYKDNEHYHVAVNLNYADIVSFDKDDSDDELHEIVVPSDVCPANRVQKSILFQKMEEAGYKWDADTKQLKKISQRMISAEAKEALYDKPTWSEEDEEMLDTLIKIFTVAYPKEYYKTNPAGETDVKFIYSSDIVNWLKLLKQRLGQ